MGPSKPAAWVNFQSTPSARQLIDISALRTALPPDIFRLSEDIIGGQMEPLSLVIAGSEKDLVNGFARAGWTWADLPTPIRLVREALAALRNRPDPSGRPRQCSSAINRKT